MNSTRDATEHEAPGASARAAFGTSEDPQNRRKTPILKGALEDAECLLHYASQQGIAVDPGVATRIIAARLKGDASWDVQNAGNLLADITTVATTVHPVTAESIRSETKKAKSRISHYNIAAVVLALLIVPLSMIAYATANIVNSITADIRSADALVVALHAQLDGPSASPNQKVSSFAIASSPQTLTQLQTFSSAIRSLQDDAAQLDRFVVNVVPNPFAKLADDAKIQRGFELDSDLRASVAALQAETVRKTDLYQRVRRFANEVTNSVAIYYGAVNASILPMLYALLGACAFLLRLFSNELNTRTFSPSYAISARLLIALIAGMIVGIFGSNVFPGSSLSPFALAFLVGYAADVFFSFLDGLMQAFARTKASTKAS